MTVTSESIYHKLLRVSSLLFAFLLIFSSGLVSPLTSQLTENSAKYAANLVNANSSLVDSQNEPILTQESVVGEGSNETYTYLFAVILFVILLLMLLNYSLHFIGKKE